MAVLRLGDGDEVFPADELAGVVREASDERQQFLGRRVLIVQSCDEQVGRHPLPSGDLGQPVLIAFQVGSAPAHQLVDGQRESFPNPEEALESLASQDEILVGLGQPLRP